MSPTGPRFLLVLIILVYLVIAILFAVYTPSWQAPDEPAHYNYVRYVAQTGTFPVLQIGDYLHAYLEEIKHERFPPGMSIDTIRYESHQPPLYYVLASPVYILAGGALLPLRLLSVMLGACLILTAYAVALRVFPARPGPALGTAAFVAFLPQHLATVSQVGNDVLAELLFALVLLQLVSWPGMSRAPSDAQPDRAPARRQSRRALMLGLLLGLGLITKTTAYSAAPLAGLVLLWGWRRERTRIGRVLADLALVAAPALVLALPWYARDLSIYGWPDFLGLMRHDAIVAGQQRTAEFLAQNGWGAYLDRLLTFTFKSFWGVFGWLGAFMDSRVYTALALLSAIVAGGLVSRVARSGLARHSAEHSTGNTQRGTSAPAPAVPFGADADVSHHALWLFVLSGLFTLLMYAWYNLQFVQHQGRYLFTALIPVGVLFGLGWEEALHRRSSHLLAAGLVILALGITAISLGTGQGLPKWPAAMALGGAALLAIRPWLPRRLDTVLFALPYALLPLVALYALFFVIIKQLG